MAQFRTRLAVQRSSSEPLLRRRGSRKLLRRSLRLVFVLCTLGTLSHERAALSSLRDAERVADATDELGSHHRRETFRLGRKLQSRSTPPSAAAAHAQGGIDPTIGPAFEPTVEFATTFASTSALMSGEKDREVLVVLHEAMGIGRKKKINWLEEGVQHCEWRGVTCDDNNRVIKLDLYHLGLAGTIPTEIGELTQLGELRLAGNNLTGTIPTEIGELKKLENLIFWRSSLAGIIPTEIGGLKKLETLIFWRSSLAGIIPTEIGELTRLYTLHLQENSLAGTIPTEIGKMTQLKILQLQENQLKGTIPTEIGYMSDLNNLHLHENRLNGSIPTEIKKLDDLLFIDLSMNELIGSIPADIGSFTRLLTINLTHNSFDSFPFDKTWPSLKSCDLSHNQFKQAIPKNLTGLSSVKELILSHNDISGRIPAQLGNLLRLERLHLDNNWLYGTIPDDLLSLSRLREFKLSDNKRKRCFDEITNMCGYDNREGQYWTNVGGNICSKAFEEKSGQFCFPDIGLWGTIPAGFGSVPYLTVLDLSGNNLAGSIPPEIGDLSRLTLLDLSNNSLTGRIPFELGALVYATVFLDGNDDLGDDEQKIAPLSLCASVHRFDLANNTDWCPLERNALKAVYDSAKGQEWTNADGWVDEYNDHCLWHGIECNDEGKVIKISLDNNGLSGRISSRITELESLSKLDLHDNNLQGSIPEQIGKLTKLSYVRFSYNDITGSVPPGLTTLSQLDLLHLHSNRMNGEASNFSFEPQIASSLVADCGSPSDFDTPLICSECTMCCNSVGECHVNTLAMSSSQMSNTKMTWVVMVSLMAFYSALAASLFFSKRTRLFISTLMFWDTADSSTLNPFSSTISAGISPTFCVSDSSHAASNSAPDCFSSTCRARSEIGKDCSPSKCSAWSAIGKDSVYSFLLSTSAPGWLVSSGTLVAQALVFGIFIQAADLDFEDDSVDWVYSWRCPRNSDECNDTSDSLVYGWIVFTILMIAFLARDLINALKLLWNFAVENQLSWENTRCFISGLCLFSITMLALLASRAYNFAIARSNTGLITNAVIILFVNDLDEKIHALLLVISPKWFCDLMSKLEKAHSEELSETELIVHMQKQNVEKQEIINEQCKEEIEQQKQQFYQHQREIDQLNAKLEALLQSGSNDA